MPKYYLITFFVCLFLGCDSKMVIEDDAGNSDFYILNTLNNNLIIKAELFYLDSVVTMISETKSNVKLINLSGGIGTYAKPIDSFKNIVVLNESNLDTLIEYKIINDSNWLKDPNYVSWEYAKYTLEIK